MPTRGLRHFVAWIALLSIFVMSLAPSISRLVAAPFGFEVCAAGMVLRTDVGDRDSRHSQDPGGAASMDHCPYCALHADLAPPPPGSTTAAPTTVAFQELPAAFLDAPRPNAVWTARQPRGPPPAA